MSLFSCTETQQTMKLLEFYVFCSITHALTSCMKLRYFRSPFRNDVFNYGRYVRFCVIKLVSYGTEKLAKLLEYLLRHKAILFNNNNYYTLNSSCNFNNELLKEK